ncbi:hypothetical protein AmaxDRAFT_5058 [Limnospira maxima CS-328]|uniref:Nif11 domain-containing protein n=1 Tax=Limnospira maxima CS-328 TaxID=513049 RepID=B5W8F8_LIMMA|nr:Nif11-like leader peptide family RiPP precursor [Limnospira maxima]EDZ92175.1 hypothetical protein AmaxDRAFT_5058 [Limnospira maxima CS-328]
MRAFIEAIANHPEWQEKIMAADHIQDLLKIATSAGYNITIKELEATLTQDFGELVLELDIALGFLWLRPHFANSTDRIDLFL